MLPTQLVNVQSFKPASTSKIALLLPLNGQAAVFGRTIQQGFEAAKISVRNRSIRSPPRNRLGCSHNASRPAAAADRWRRQPFSGVSE